MEVTTDLLTQKLDSLQDYQMDALILSFLNKSANPINAINRQRRGDKINDFVYWASIEGVLEEAYWRTFTREERITLYLRDTLPAHLSEIASVGSVERLNETFVERTAEMREQQGIHPMLLQSHRRVGKFASSLHRQREGELHLPRTPHEVFCSEAQSIPDILSCLRGLSRVALLGEPGGGKTFLLSKLALDYAEDYRKTEQGVIPIFVPLSKYDTDSDREPLVNFETFCQSRLGPLAALYRELEVVWLLDALNEMPRTKDQWKHLDRFLEGLAGSEGRFVVSCRVINYERELAYVPGLYRVDLQELNPQQIHAILECYLPPEERDSIWTDVLRGTGLLQAWADWKETVRRFWERPEGHWWNWKENEKARNAVHDDPRKLMLLCRNPFTLVELLIPRLQAAIEEAQTMGEPLAQWLEKYLPANRAELFRAVIGDLLLAESDKDHWPEGTIAQVTGLLEWTASALQATEQRTEMALADLKVSDRWPAAGEDLLKKGRGAGLVTLSETGVRFNHQLFQEYFATRKLSDLLADYDRRHPNRESKEALPPRDDEGLSELFPVWWDAGGWRVTVTLIGELAGRVGISRVARWLAGYAPEIALQCVLDNNDGVGLSDLTSEARAALAAGAQSRITEADPVGRAAAYRVLGHPQIDADRRPGIGLLSAGVPEIVWGEVVVPGDYPVGGDEEAFRPLPSQTFSLTYGYQLSKYPVTNAQFQCFVDANEAGYNNRDYWTEAGLEWKGERRAPEEIGPGFAYLNHPRINVRWYEAMAFCSWLTALYRSVGLLSVKQEIRLPTDFEWEIGARGPEGLLFPYGNDFDVRKGNVSATGIGQTSAVGIFPDGASPYGVLDMSGNVWEWCLTSFSDGSNDPSGTASRVLRGGGWSYSQYSARAGARYDLDPSTRTTSSGFALCVCPIEILNTDG